MRGVETRQRGHCPAVQRSPPSDERSRLRSPPPRRRSRRLLPIASPNWIRSLLVRRRRASLRIRSNSPTISGQSCPSVTCSSSEAEAGSSDHLQPTEETATQAQGASYTLGLEPLVFSDESEIQFIPELGVLRYSLTRLLRLELGEFLPSVSSRLRVLR